MIAVRFIVTLALFGAVITGCQRKPSASVRVNSVSGGSAGIDTKVSGTVYDISASSTSLTNEAGAPVANVTVTVYQLNTTTLVPTLMTTTASGGTGAYAASLTVGEKAQTLLIVAMTGSVSTGQTIVSVPALENSSSRVRVLKGDITKTTTALASLILGKNVNLSSLNSAVLEKIASSVADEMKSKSTSSLNDLVTSMASSTSFLSKLATVIGDNGIATARPSSAISNITSMVPAASTASKATSAATVTSIEVQASSTQVAKGLTVTLKAYGNYSDNTRVDISSLVTWSSSSDSIVAVTKSTTVTALGAGVGSATVTATYGGKSGTASITVSAPELLSIDITPKSLSLPRFIYRQFTATGIYTDNSTADLTATATWTSNASGVATVSDTSPSKGLVLTSTAGAGSITAAVGSVSASVTFTVTSATLASVQLTPTGPSRAAGLTALMTATGNYSDSTTQDLTSYATWSSGDTSVATVSNTSGSKGTVTTVAAGTSLISAVFSGVTGSQTITVTAAEITAVQLTPSSATLAKGTTTDIAATGIFSDSTNSDITSLATWSSSNTGVATVSTSGTPRGRITAVNVGTATITATYSGQSLSLIVTVTAATLVSLAVTPSTPTTALGNPRQFTATGTYTDSTTADITNSVTWSSSNTAKATISNASGSNGLATTLATGTSTISATLNSITGSTVFTVSAATLVSIAVTPSSTSVAKGTTQQYTATGTYSDGTTPNITTLVTWSSGTLATGTISNASGSEGLLSAIDAGSSTITATLNSISGTSSLTVTSASLVSIAVTPGTPSVANGLTQQFTATGTYSDATTADITTQVTWQSATISAATISNVNGSRGLASTLAMGTSLISATSGAVTGQTTLTVAAASLQSIAVTPTSPSVAKGNTLQFTATGTYSDSSTQDLTSTVTWASATASTATIDSSGLASTIATGTSSISAVSGGKTGSTTLTVTAAELVSIAVTPANGTIDYAATQPYVATGTYTDASTSVITGSSAWTSSNTAKATINASTGLATGAGVGTTTITATKSGISGSTGLTVAAQAAPANITISSAVADSASQITVSWGAGSYPTASYKIAYQSGGSAPADCTSGSSTASTSASISGLTANTAYSFRVCSVNSNATPDVSSGDTITRSTLPNPPSTPTSLAASPASQTSMTITWADVASETGYELQTSTDNSTWSDLDTSIAADATSKTHTGLTANTLYYYRIRSKNSGGNSSYSSSTSGTTLPNAPSTPTSLAASPASQTSMTITWADVASETGYELQTSTDNSTWSDLDTSIAADATSKTHTGLTANTLYYYRIRSKNSGGNSSYSSSTSGTTLPNAPSTPTGLAAAPASQTSMTITWADVASETGYELQTSTDNSTWSDLDTSLAANATSKTHTGLTANTLYYYRIRSKNSGGNSSYSSSTSGTTLPNAPSTPTGLAASAASQTSMTITWNDVASETGYELQVSTDNSNWSDLDTSIAANATSKTHTGLTASSTRYYRIRAKNTGGNSSYSSSVSGTTSAASPPPDPTGLSEYNGAYGTFDMYLTFTSGGGTTDHFKVAWAQSTTNAPADCNSGNVIANYVSGTAIHITLPITMHAFRVCAVDASGNVSTGITGSYQSYM